MHIIHYTNPSIPTQKCISAQPFLSNINKPTEKTKVTVSLLFNLKRKSLTKKNYNFVRYSRNKFLSKYERRQDYTTCQFL